MLRDRRLNRRSLRFREAELQEDPETQNVQPVPAAQEEVDAAANETNAAPQEPQEDALVDEETPATETSTQEDGSEDQNPDLVASEGVSGDAPEEEEVPQEENQPEETAEPVAEPDQAMFTPPAEGYVPSGWVKIEDLAAAVAQVTGDAEVASTAPDTQSAIVNGKTLNTEATNPTEFPEEGSPEDQPIEESKKSKGRKFEEAEEDVPEGEEGSPEENIPEEDEGEDLSEEEEDAKSDEEDDLEDDTEEDDAVDAVDQMLAEPTEEDADLLRKVDSFINDIQDDAENWKDEVEKDQDEFEDHVGKASDSLANSSEFLRGLLEDPRDEDDDLEDDEDIDDEDDLGDEDFEDEEDLDEDEDFDDEDEDGDDLDDEEDQYVESRRRHFNSSRNMKESYEGFLPAGSEHFQDEDNLVESYKRTAAARRHAIAKFRESIKKRSSNYERDNSRNFSEALRAPRSVFRENSHDSRAWSSNRFEEKFEEKQKLNYKELLENGFLG